MGSGRSSKEKPLTDRGLASRLKQYDIKSKTVRIGDATAKGYEAADFYDAWDRYCPSPSGSRNKRHSRHIFDNENNYVSDVTAVTPPQQREGGNGKSPLEAPIEDDLEIPDSLRRCAHCGGGPEPGNPVNKVVAPDGEELVPVHRLCAEEWMKIELEGE